MFAATAHAEGPYGSGSAQVWILRPGGEVRSVVVFTHGWNTRPWLLRYDPWVRHLVAGGSAVVFPRYQLGGDAPGPARVEDYRKGLKAAFARLDTTAPVIVAGHSYGGSLALVYAANARRWGLPAPSAVDLVFPAGLLPGVAMPRLDPGVFVLVQVGDRDRVAGRPDAIPILRWLRGHDRTRYELVRSTASFSAGHESPELASPAAQRAYWDPLDRLVERVR